MRIARRNLLGLGAAVALSAATVSCRAAGQDGSGGSGPSTTTTSTTPSPTSVAPTAPPPAFTGQPPPGHVYYGASLPAHRSLSQWEATLGSTLAVNRSYFTPDVDETAQLVRQCQDDLLHQRLPHVSTKVPGTWKDVADGALDTWLTDLLGLLGDEHAPIFLTLHHEPENDAGPAGMTSSDYVAMQRRSIGLAADLAPQVTVVPVLQHWSFEPLNTGGDPSAWIVREAAVMGVDVYNAWSPTNGKVWRSFGSRVDDVIGWLGDTPLVIGEYGCREDPMNPGMAADWLRDAADYARTHNIVSMSYFNSDVHSPDGSLELSSEMEQVFAELLSSDWVSRPV
jgi:hypothetical protein